MAPRSDKLLPEKRPRLLVRIGRVAEEATEGSFWVVGVLNHGAPSYRLVRSTVKPRSGACGCPPGSGPDRIYPLRGGVAFERASGARTRDG